MKRHSLLRLSVPAAAVLLGPVVAAAPALAAAPTAPTVTEVGTSVVIGQTVKFKFTEPDGSQPAEYHWLLNSGELFGSADATNGKAPTQREKASLEKAAERAVRFRVTAVSRACARASTPVQAVTLAGWESVSSGSGRTLVMEIQCRFAERYSEA